MSSQDPQRLLESELLSTSERTMLEMGRDVAPTHYDVAAGASRFRASLDGLAVGGGAGAGGAGAGAAGVGAAIKLGAMLLLPALAAAAAYYGYVLRPHAEPGGAPQLAPVIASVPPSAAGAGPGAAAVPQGAPQEASADRPPSTQAAPGAFEVQPKAPAREPATERSRDHARARARVAASHEASRVEPTPQRPNAVAQAKHASQAEPIVVQEAKAAEPERAARPAATEETVAPRATETPAPPGPIDELRGIARARLLVRSEPKEALRLLERLAKDHPKGYFVEERSALTVLALAASGDEDLAERRGQAFLRMFPKSSFAARVREAIDE